MKALLLDHYGPLEESVRVTDVPAPAPLAGEVLIDVHAAGVNPIDWKIAEGHAKAWIPLKLPIVLGNEVAGVVRAVGSNVTRFKPGDEVYGRVDGLRAGTFAEQVAVDEKLLARKPASIDFVSAAAIPLAGLTAWQLLFEHLKIAKGHHVLVHAGSGGVGTFAIQFARHAGARVSTTVGTEAVALARSLGAERAVDYRKEKFEEVLSGVDVVVDTLGGETQARSLAVMKRGGVLASVVGVSVAPAAAEEAGVRVLPVFMHPDAAQLAEIAKLVDAGDVKPVLDKVFSLDDAVQALQASREGRSKGKLVIRAR